MKRFHPALRSRKPHGFTLIELMLATGLGLMLLVGLVKIIAMVNTAFADTRVLIDLQNRCRSTQMILQQDLSHISVTPQAPRPFQLDDGYLSLGSVTSDVRNENKLKRGNLWLVDSDLVENSCDYAAFTVFNRENPFTFTDPNNSNRTLQTPYAEVVWFVYRNDLYRVAVPFVNSPQLAKNYSANANRTESHVTSAIPTVRMISPGMLGDFPNRLMNYGTGVGNFLWNQCSSNGGSTVANQLLNCMVLPNVISFKVQVWDPWNERYYDLNEMGSSNYYDHKTFRYGSSPLNSTGTTVRYDSGSTLSYVGSSAAASTSSVLGTHQNAVARSNGNYFHPDETNDYYQPPTTAFLPGMRIIVRAFDPDSGTVREFRVGHEFRTH